MILSFILVLFRWTGCGRRLWRNIYSVFFLVATEIAAVWVVWELKVVVNLVIFNWDAVAAQDVAVLDNKDSVLAACIFFVLIILNFLDLDTASWVSGTSRLFCRVMAAVFFVVDVLRGFWGEPCLISNIWLGLLNFTLIGKTTQSEQLLVLLFFLLVTWWIEGIFLDIEEQFLETTLSNLELSILVFARRLLILVWLTIDGTAQDWITIFFSRIKWLDLLELFLSNKFVSLLHVSLWKVHNLSLKAIDCQSLSCRYFKHSVDVNNYLVEIGIIFFKLLKSLLLIDIENLFLDPDPLPLLLLDLLLQVEHNHVPKWWLSFDSSDFGQHSDHDVFQFVLKAPGLKHSLVFNSFFLQVVWQTHYVIQWKLLVFNHCLLFEVKEIPFQNLMLRNNRHEFFVVKNSANWVSPESIVNFAVVFHEKGSVINNWATE